jgi:glucuronate isomerase
MVVDPDFEGFAKNLVRFGELTGCDTATWTGYLEAHRKRRAVLQGDGRDRVRPRPSLRATADLKAKEAGGSSPRCAAARPTPRRRDLFRGQMLTEMARMSLDDGLVLQIHPGSRATTIAGVLRRFGRDKGFDIPTRTDYVAR